jgi:hypothetical protein
MAKGKIELKISEGGSAAYISLPDHPANAVPGSVQKTLRLLDLHPDHAGPDVYFDFDNENRLIGIEVLM